MPTRKTSAVSKQKKDSAPSKAVAVKPSSSRKEKATNGHAKHGNEQVLSASVQEPLAKVAIEKRAWEIWQNEGCPMGRELEHWLQAEQELSRRS